MTPSFRRAGVRTVLGLGAVALAVAATGFVYRSWASGADRRAALAAAESAPPAEALPALRAVLDRHPTDPQLLRATTLATIRAGAAPADAEPLAARWAEAAPDDPEPHRVRFDLLRVMHRADEAAAAGARAAALLPTDYPTRARLAQMYLQVGRPADAARELTALLAVPGLPHDALAVGLAKAEADAGDPAAAARRLDALLARAPAHPEGLSLRATLHLRAGEYEAAVAAARRSRPADAQDRETVCYTLASALDRLGRADEAAATLATLRAIQDAARFSTDARARPDDLAFQVRAAEARLAAGDPGGGAEILRAAFARSVPSRPALDLLARCYDRLNLPGAAAEARGRAATLP